MVVSLGPPPQASVRPSRRRAAVAGAVGAAVALGLAEALASLLAGASPVAAVGAVVVDRVPGPVERAAIDLFGQADKAVLQVGVVVVAVSLGAAVGAASRGRRWLPATAFLAAALAGMLALARDPQAAPFAGVAALALAAAAGVLTLRLLLRWAAAGAHVAAGGSRQGADVAAGGSRQGADVAAGGSRQGADVAAGGSHHGAHVAAGGSHQADTDTARRRFLAAAGAALVAGALAAAVGRASLGRALQRARGPVALPTPIEPVIAPGAGQALDVPGLTPIVVPNPDFYRIDVNLVVPRVQADGWRLTITGMVDRDVELSYQDLLGMPLVERYVTIACVSNEVGGGLVGNAAWTGVPLVDLLDRAGVQAGASQIVGRSVDGWTAGFPTALAYDGRDPLVAVGMNGEPLPASHGFPARLIVPGLYGYVSATKWLREIELTTLEGFDAFWIPRGWAKHGPVLTQSRIDVPRPGRVDAGRVVVAGVAWAPHVGIEGVELRIDDGPWRQAETTRPLSDDAWVQWRHRWDAAPGRHALQVRATDRTGATQTVERTPPFPDGATGHHQVVVTVV